ncbi:ABC transporter substrate-binding protein [Butyricicoccus sp. 1XD8-22]|nr:ABC transporter substrate-binding protein [Butyricicoccus sp. 1XD8-22]
MKKNLMSILIICLVFILAACGGSTQSTGSTGSTGTTTGETSGGETSSEETKKLVIAEPVHNVGYLPVYAAIHEGYFAEEGLEVEIITATGGGHVTTVVSGEVWGNIGGPESNQMANNGSPDPIVSVVNVANRANVYLMAQTGLEVPDPSDEEAFAEFLKGKTISAHRYGGSLNVLTRWLLLELGLDPEKDVVLEELADPAAAISLVESGKAQIANGAEPQIKDGLAKGVWDEPFYKFTDLGDYPYSVISVRKSTIDEDPETVQKFVNAVIKGLKAINEDRALAEEIFMKEFPTSDETSMKAALDRAFEDELWSKDGFITEESLALTMEVVEKTGIYTDGYSYDELIDMQFVESSDE